MSTNQEEKVDLLHVMRERDGAKNSEEKRWPYENIFGTKNNLIDSQALYFMNSSRPAKA